MVICNYLCKLLKKMYIIISLSIITYRLSQYKGYYRYVYSYYLLVIWLLIQSHEGSRILGYNLNELPMILTVEFNFNFTTNDSIPLKIFLEYKFYVKINNKPDEPTTGYGTAIDAVFSRYLYIL